MIKMHDIIRERQSGEQRVHYITGVPGGDNPVTCAQGFHFINLNIPHTGCPQSTHIDINMQDGVIYTGCPNVTTLSRNCGQTRTKGQKL